jgi:perosamine synthetase
VIRLAVPDIDETDIEGVAEVLRSGFLVQGEHVRKFEERVAAYVGSTHGVAVSNCTAALHLSLLALGVGPGDRVAVTSYSWPATANVIVLCGAEPVFVDIDPRSYNMAPGELASTLARTSQVKAVLPVHAFGNVADMPAILEAAAMYGVPVVEDAACALGASLLGRRAGMWGRLACFSFHPRKAITTGEGGMITTDDGDLARRLRALRNHGLDPDAAGQDFVLPGYNLRLTEFQGALGVSQMEKLEASIARRRGLAARYDGLFQGTSISSPSTVEARAHVYQSYVVLLPSEVATRRSEIIAAMREHGIETTIGTYHMPLTTFFKSYGRYERGHFPVTDDVAARAMTLPLHGRLTIEMQAHVADTLLSLL